MGNPLDDARPRRQRVNSIGTALDENTGGGGGGGYGRERTHSFGNGLDVYNKKGLIPGGGHDGQMRTSQPGHFSQSNMSTTAQIFNAASKMSSFNAR